VIKPDIVVGLLRSLREHVGYLRRLQNLTLVDLVIVDDLLHNRLGDFDEFALHIYDYLRREGHLPSEEKVE